MNLELGKHYTVKVTEIIKVGAVVEVTRYHTELIHLSKIANDFVKNIEDYVAVGDTLDAECVKGFNKLELSLKHLNLTNRNQARRVSEPRGQSTYQNRERIEHSKEPDFYKDQDDYDKPKTFPKKQKVKNSPSLDEIIMAANNVCEDKVRRMNKRNRDKRYKNKNY